MKLTKGFYFAGLAALAWAASIIASRFMLHQGENAYNLLFWVTVLAIPFWLFTVLKSTSLSELKVVLKKNYGLLLGMGLISTFGVNITEAFALKYSQAINYAFLIRSTVFFTIIFAYVLLGEKLTKKKLVLVAVILLGAYLLTTNGQLLTFSLGDIFTLTEAALIALGNNVFGKLATNRMKPQVSAAASFLVGVIPVVIIALFQQAIAWPQLPWLIVLMTVTDILIVVFRFRAYTYATASFVSMVFSLTPVLVAILAMLFLGETMTWLQLVGGVLILLAGLAVNKVKV